MKVLIILFALAVLAFIITCPLIRQSIKRQKRGQEGIEGIEEMYPCAHCGTYVAKSQALLANGACYCSKECLKKVFK